MLQEKIINLENLIEEKNEALINYLIHNNFELFEYIFYTLKINKNNLLNLNNLLDEIIKTKNIKNINRFLNAPNVIAQINFNLEENNERDFGYSCTLNKACLTGSLQVVKYFIEKHGLSPQLDGSTVTNACLSGNLNLVKYLIEEKNANYHYFYKEVYTFLMNKTLKDFIFPFELLDESTLTDALKSDNVELLKYLILNKKLKIEEYDHLALRTALIYGYKSYSYLITLKECQDYLKNNA